MIPATSRLLTLPRAIWSFVRALSCDNAYDSYVQHHRAAHPELIPLSRREFYLREQQRKWDGVSRCC
jgi:uncharacterized short protein YbdD (DUF466 family)